MEWWLDYYVHQHDRLFAHSAFEWQRTRPDSFFLELRGFFCCFRIDDYTQRKTDVRTNAIRSYQCIRMQTNPCEGARNVNADFFVCVILYVRQSKQSLSEAVAQSIVSCNSIFFSLSECVAVGSVCVSAFRLSVFVLSAVCSCRCWCGMSEWMGDGSQ